jgi:hypothetical protein
MIRTSLHKASTYLRMTTVVEGLQEKNEEGLLLFEGGLFFRLQ